MNQIDGETVPDCQSILVTVRSILHSEASCIDVNATAQVVSVTAVQPGKKRFGANRYRYCWQSLKDFETSAAAATL